MYLYKSLYIFFSSDNIYSQYDKDSRHKCQGTKEYVINKIASISVLKVY